ncbi:hypothetical protein Taro_018555 [Colocasia esculenta]|uniref:Uncharacterized protein n=1 Tax=Colocasia esculenta TaxID=4460 RepID=A0A843V2S9_COLES|nr:hypothetical protein [Colocasia esculenta]
MEGNGAQEGAGLAAKQSRELCSVEKRGYEAMFGNFGLETRVLACLLGCHVLNATVDPVAFFFPRCVMSFMVELQLNFVSMTARLKVFTGYSFLLVGRARLIVVQLCGCGSVVVPSGFSETLSGGGVSSVLVLQKHCSGLVLPAVEL